jgi:N-methylhydantoinase A/oxoprolinase/acetone carboxylase beta subunit
VFDLNAGNYGRCPEFARDALVPLEWHPGPVVISEPQTTTVVPKGWRVQLARDGHLVLENSGQRP